MAKSSESPDSKPDAHRAGQVQGELVGLAHYPRGSSTKSATEGEAANLFYRLLFNRYERASLIVSSNKPFGRSGQVSGEDVVAAAMIDRRVHHPDVVLLEGDSCRRRDRDLGRPPVANTGQ